MICRELESGGKWAGGVMLRFFTMELSLPKPHRKSR